MTIVNCIKVTFKDEGQDFLTFTIHPVSGRILDVKPFQFSVWSKYRVLNPLDSLQVGDRIILGGNGFKSFMIKYPIERVESTEYINDEYRVLKKHIV